MRHEKLKVTQNVSFQSAILQFYGGKLNRLIEKF